MAIEMDFGGRWKGPRDLGTRTLGTAWRDIGTAVTVGGAVRASAFLSMQIHNGTGARFRLVGQYSSSGSAFGLPAHAVGTGIVEVNDLVYELAQDADQRIALQWDLGGGMPFVKLQGQVAAGSAAYVSDAQLVTSV